MPDTFSIDFACLQISSFEKVILYSFWDIPPVKIGKHAQVKHFPNPSAKRARLPQIKTVKLPDKKPGISDRSSFLRRRSVKFQFVWPNCVQYNIPLAGLLQKHVGIRDSSATYQKCFVCLALYYESVRFIETTTCQCRQLKLNLSSTQINFYCLMANQTPALLRERELQ